MEWKFFFVYSQSRWKFHSKTYTNLRKQIAKFIRKKAVAVAIAMTTTTKHESATKILFEFGSCQSEPVFFSLVPMLFMLKFYISSKFPNIGWSKKFNILNSLKFYKIYMLKRVIKCADRNSYLNFGLNGNYQILAWE